MTKGKPDTAILDRGSGAAIGPLYGLHSGSYVFLRNEIPAQSVTAPEAAERFARLFFSENVSGLDGVFLLTERMADAAQTAGGVRR